MILLQFHWWLMHQAARYDRIGYPYKARVLDWIGGRVANVWYWLFRRKKKPASEFLVTGVHHTDDIPSVVFDDEERKDD